MEDDTAQSLYTVEDRQLQEVRKTFMYSIAICDDEERQRERVKTMLVGLSVKSGVEFAIEEFSSGEQLLERYQQRDASFHILILDIEMSGLSGIDTARAIRELGRRDEQIVFLTSYAEYMLESFDVVTFQYILKPVETEVFEEKMLKLCHYLQRMEHRLLVIKSASEELVLKHDDIISIEAVASLTIKGQLQFVTTEDSHESRGLISNYAAALKEHHFLQIHRSIIINLSHVRKFTSGRVLMTNGAELPIGRSKLKEVKDAYTKFMVMSMDV